MTSKIIFASNKLGTLEDQQIQDMLSKFNLGKLVSFKKTDHGAMGQTLFVTSNKGNYVFKGNPLYEGQLIEERYFIKEMDKRTDTVVPAPYIIDDSNEIFGWSYAIMPKLKGEHLNSEILKNSLKKEDKLKIAESIAETLRSFHEWRVNECGELNVQDFTITPFRDSYPKWLFNRIRYWLDDAKKYSKISNQDIAWVEKLLVDSEENFKAFSSPTFVMGDFKPGNFLVDGVDDWKVSGVFDFTNSYFADPISDLIKMITYYTDNDEEELAKHLVDTYFNKVENREDIMKRLKVHMLHQRLLDWGSAKATKMVTWDDDLPFFMWVKTYTDLIENIVE
ncbi:aminoglycoside phosphotransferase family protein [Robertmurraya sp. FSL W8-0741]|uniref:aminoglycoside phosphotransferase family protein n=1 Tax=Robertmurraya sp. FSL W8-0741 TaxID=2954629 RepID=UPI0030F6AD39